MVLAIGLVVDDAIIVVENVHRHIERGEPRMQAALKGARELAVPIIAMTTTLLAVYAPIGFMGGLTGALFIECARTRRTRRPGVGAGRPPAGSSAPPPRTTCRKGFYQSFGKLWLGFR